MTIPAPAAAGRRGGSAANEPVLLLTIEQACARLQIGRTTLWRAGRDGLIRFTPIGRGGRGKRVHVDDLEAYARRLREGAA